MCTLQMEVKLVLLLAAFCLAGPCLITNCPRGGKRVENNHTSTSKLAKPANGENELVERDIVHCFPCGAEDNKMCLGENICCEKETRCSTAVRIAKMCWKVNSFCFMELKIFTCKGQGECKTKYLCCLQDRCILGKSCETSLFLRMKGINPRVGSKFHMNAFSLFTGKNSILKVTKGALHNTSVMKSRNQKNYLAQFSAD